MSNWHTHVDTITSWAGIRWSRTGLTRHVLEAMLRFLHR